MARRVSLSDFSGTFQVFFRRASRKNPRRAFSIFQGAPMDFFVAPSERGSEVNRVFEAAWMPSDASGAGERPSSSAGGPPN